MKRVFLFIIVFVVQQSWAQLGFSPAECLQPKTINYSYQNFSSGGGSSACAWYKIYKNGSTLFSSQVCCFGSSSGAPQCWWMKFASDTVGYYAANPNCTQCYDVNRTVDFAQSFVSQGSFCPLTSPSALSIVNNDAAYFIGGYSPQFIRRMSVHLGNKDFYLQTTLNDTIVYDSLYGSPFCTGQTQLNYAYLNGTDTVNYTIVFKINPNSIPEASVSSFKIYPNPANTILNIQMNKFNNSHFKMVNIIGEELISEEIKKSDFEIDVSPLSNGIYFLKITDGEKSFSKKVIVQH